MKNLQMIHRAPMLSSKKSEVVHHLLKKKEWRDGGDNNWDGLKNLYYLTYCGEDWKLNHRQKKQQFGIEDYNPKSRTHKNKMCAECQKTLKREYTLFRLNSNRPR